MNEKGLLIIPGAQKSGTTTLWNMLLQHPSVHPLTMPPGEARKESQFFSLDEKSCKKYADWYLSMVGDKKGWYVDASTSYLMCLKKKTYLIDSLPLPVKYLIILRDPAERALSGYLHMSGKTPPADQRSFEEVVNPIYESEKRIMEEEEKQIKESIRGGKINGSYLKDVHLKGLPASRQESEFSDPLWPYKYLSYSLYSHHIEELGLNHDNLLIITLDGLTSAPKEVGNRILDFLEASRKRIPIPHSRRTKIRPQWWRKASHMLSKIGWVEGLLESNWISYFKRKIRPNGHSKQDIKTRVKEMYLRTRRLLKTEYEYWKKKHPKIEEQWNQ